MKNFRLCLFAAGVLGALALAACEPRQVVVEKAQFRAPLGGAGVGVGYFTIRSPAADRIVGVSSSDAEAVEIHASVMTGDMMGMERVEGVDLPAGQDVVFGPGGLHLMVFSPKAMGADATFPITFQLESGATATVAFQGVAGAVK